MIILGLGSNLGDRFENLRNALFQIRKISSLRVKYVSPLYISDALLPVNAPHNWNLNYINLAIGCETSQNPIELLNTLKQIERLLGRTPHGRWGPRVIDIDILAWDNLTFCDNSLHIPHKSLLERPFALWPLADIAPRWVYPSSGEFQGKTASELSAQWPSRFSGAAPFQTQQIAQRIDTPVLMGIVNLTPNSFSADGSFQNPQNALQHTHQLLKSGAEIIDIGAESTGPHATAISADEEWLRLEPFLDLLTTENFFIKPKISIDTYHLQTLERLTNYPIDIINDVSGTLYPLISKTTLQYVFMHHLHIPENRNFFLPLTKDPIDIILSWALKKIRTMKLNPDQLIFDVGIGYGKTAEQSLEVLQRLSELKSLGIKLLVGHSRKSFFQQFTSLPPQERDIETIAASLTLNSDFLRIHNVDAHSRAFKVFKSFCL